MYARDFWVWPSGSGSYSPNVVFVRRRFERWYEVSWAPSEDADPDRHVIIDAFWAKNYKGAKQIATKKLKEYFIGKARKGGHKFVTFKFSNWRRWG